MSAYDYLLDRVRESQERERAAKMEADRCQQLADLEREIGQAVIGYSILDTDFDRMPDSTDNVVLVDYAYFMGTLELAQWQAVARWRKLHAEGAGGER